MLTDLSLMTFDVVYSLSVSKTFFLSISNLVNCGSFSWVGEPRTAVLHKGKKGFGFVLRGAKAASPLMEMIPSEKCPGLQYMDDVDPGGVADMAGLRKGDFLLEVICSFFDLEPLLNLIWLLRFAFCHDTAILKFQFGPFGMEFGTIPQP